MESDCCGYVKLMNIFIGKRLRIFSFATLGFVLGWTFALAIITIDKTCRIEDTDIDYNIMENSNFNSPELIILILSAPTSFEKRAVVRKSWLKLKPIEYEKEKLYRVKHYFAVGVLSLEQNIKDNISQEQTKYSDILMLPIKDSYKNLTEKVKYSFQWLDRQFDYGLDFKYMLKCDDDSFVNLKEFTYSLINIEKYLNVPVSLGNLQGNYENILSTNLQLSGPRKSKVNLYWGYFSGNTRIKTRGKWQELDWIVSDKYIPYALGGGYLLSKDLVSYIGRNTEYLKSFNSEDVSVAFWLSPINNIFRIHDTRFDTEWISRGCNNSHLVTHHISTGEMQQLYDNLIKSDKMCSKEFTNRSSYIYNWNVPPSQCCKVYKIKKK